MLGAREPVDGKRLVAAEKETGAVLVVVFADQGQ
jgi:hypothetical protein